MRIGINLLCYSPNYIGGVNTFTHGLIGGLINAINEGDSISLIVDYRHQDSFVKYKHKKNVSIICMDYWSKCNFNPIINFLLQFSCFKPLADYVADFLQKENTQIIHNNIDCQIIPYCPPLNFPWIEKLSIVSLHDVQHKTHPQFFKGSEIKIRQAQFERAIKKSDLIQASSQQMKIDFLRYLPVDDQSRIKLISEGVDLEVYSRRKNEQSKDSGIITILYPAQFWPHKNHQFICKALIAVKNQVKNRLRFVFTGDINNIPNYLLDSIKNNGLEEIIEIKGRLDLDQLIECYSDADFVMSASLSESNCLPILEAIALEKPILASRISVNYELLEFFKFLLFDPYDTNELEMILLNIANNSINCEDQVRNNYLSIKLFGWQAVANKYIECLNNND